MHLKELLRAINDMRLKLQLPPVLEECFIEEITTMQYLGMVDIIDGFVTRKEVR